MDLEPDLGISGFKVYVLSTVTHCLIMCGKLKEESLESLPSNREMENVHTCIYTHRENVYVCVGIHVYIMYRQRNRSIQVNVKECTYMLTEEGWWYNFTFIDRSLQMFWRMHRLPLYNFLKTVSVFKQDKNMT